MKPLQYDRTVQRLVNLLELRLSFIWASIELVILLTMLIFRANSDGKCVVICDQMLENKIEADRKIVFARGFRIFLKYFSNRFVSVWQFTQTLSVKNYEFKIIVFQ